MLLHSKAGGAELPGEPQATVVPLGMASAPFCLFLSGFSWSTCLSQGSNGCYPKSIHPKLFPVSFPFSMQYLSLSQISTLEIPKFCPLVRPPLTLYSGFLTCLTPLSLIPHQQVPWSLQLKDSFSCPISRVANSPPVLVTCSGAPYETQ